MWMWFNPQTVDDDKKTATQHCFTRFASETKMIYKIRPEVLKINTTGISSSIQFFYSQTENVAGQNWRTND
jgi:hypothetical protein